MGLSQIELVLRKPGGRAKFEEWCRKRGYDPKKEIHRWAWRARPEQRAPRHSNWDTWLILAGRGFGKTRTGAETMHAWAMSGTCKRMAFVGATAADVRDVMVNGESGILAVAERDGVAVVYEPSKRLLTWPNGAIATLYSAEKPNRLRGPQHDGSWCDELPFWRDAQACWDMLQFGLRLGSHPRTVVTCTPRPTPLVKALVRDPRIHVTKGTTYDNSKNLASTFLAAVKRAYEGTRLGRQELNAEILDDNPNALWKQINIDAYRVAAGPTSYRRVGVAIDPAVSSNEDSDLTGIVSGGIAPCWVTPKCGGEIHGFVFDDISGIYTPLEWAQAASAEYEKRRADFVVGEINNGGDLVEANLRGNGSAGVRFKSVRASRGKETRAEPVAGLYEQGKIHHIGTHGKLEDEMTQWDPISGMRSPDRMDALVWLMTELMLDPFAMAPGYRKPNSAPPRR